MRGRMLTTLWPSTALQKANELLAHSYSHLFSLPTTGLRFFTVYGPWGRPDMALFKFTEAILNGRAIDVYNKGELIRDFTYIDDVVESVVRLVNKPATAIEEFDTALPDAGLSNVPWRIFNIGNGEPTPLMDYISALEQALGIQAEKNFVEMQPGDVLMTSADTSRLSSWVGFKPYTPVKEGVKTSLTGIKRLLIRFKSSQFTTGHYMSSPPVVSLAYIQELVLK